MKKFTPILFIIFLALQIANAQNLVPNPSFEEYNECPDGISQLERVVNWYIFSHFNNTPDYYNSCAPSSSYASVPDNYGGSRCPFIGFGYIGLYTISSNIPNYREIIYCKLNDSLNIGTKYYISFTISSTIHDFLNSYSNNLGLLFTTDVDTSKNLINNYSQIHIDSIINTNNNWKTYTFSFIADSVYKYMFVGNFFDDNNTNTVYTGLNLAYYYVDNILLSADSTDLVLSKEDFIQPLIGSNTITQDSCIEFSLDTTTVYNDYNWYFEGGTPSYSNLPNPVVCYDSTGVFDVSLIASNIYSCNDTLVFNNFITVTKPEGINQFSNSFELINNPYDNYIIIKPKTSANINNINIYDILGKQIKTSISKTTGLIKITLNQNTKNGIYILKITNNKNQSFSKKIVKF